MNAYHSYCKMFNIQWEPVRVKYKPKIPYIPTEEECLIFIGGLTKTLSIFCRLLYETGARRGEACKVEWSDIDVEKSTVTVNHPEKGSNPRIIRIPRECIELLNTLRRREHQNYICNPDPDAYDAAFYRQRRKIADKNGKPQFLKIHFHTFRHVRGTMDIHNATPLWEVKDKLGHRYIANTEKYVHWNRLLYHEKSDRYSFASASADEEAGKLIETGWEYVCNNPSTGRMLFRKPK